MAWAHGKLGLNVVPLQRALSSKMRRCLEELDARTLSNLAWGSATVSYLDRELLLRMADAFLERSCGVQELGTMAWCYATLEISVVPLLEFIGQEALRQVLEP